MTMKHHSALRMFRAGYSTFEIVQIVATYGIQITEADVERLVSEQRSLELGLPSPYPGIRVVARSA